MSELLERHRPVLRFDRQYDYRPSSVEGVIENPGNLLRTGYGELIARAGGDPTLSLELLTAYPEGWSAAPLDAICMSPDIQGDARRMEAAGQLGCLYGRELEDGGRTWLQYWFWLLYNPKNLFGFGKHEGDWEMVQYGLGPDREIEVATYAQHNAGEAAGRDRIEFVEREGGMHPVVYVAPLSHASYFEARTHPYPVGIDHPYGDGPSAFLPVEPFGRWVEWPGRWGNSERAILGKLGNAPAGPGFQASKWESPARFHSKTRRRVFRRTLGGLMHRLGGPFYPIAPKISYSIEGQRCEIRYELRQTRLRRSRHLYLTVHDGERVIASRIVRCAADSGSEVLRLPSAEVSDPAVCATTWNKVRQRSDLTSAPPPTNVPD
jgi:hypothetical protein